MPAQPSPQSGGGQGRSTYFIVFNERHLRRLLRAYLAYYNAARPHQSLGNDSPAGREAETAAAGRVVALPEVGGWHHQYRRVA
jgi:putative transposase